MILRPLTSAQQLPRDMLNEEVNIPQLDDTEGAKWDIYIHTAKIDNISKAVGLAIRSNYLVLHLLEGRI